MGVGCGGRGIGLRKLKLSGLDGPWGVRRGQSQRCPLVSDVSEWGLQGQHQDGNGEEGQV